MAPALAPGMDPLPRRHLPDTRVGLTFFPLSWTGLSGQYSLRCLSPSLLLPRKAKMMLDDIVSRGRGGPPGQFHDNANGGQNGTVQEIMIPAGKAGLVIGKGGETIKQLQVRAGTEAPPVPGKSPSCICVCIPRRLLCQSLLPSWSYLPHPRALAPESPLKAQH